MTLRVCAAGLPARRGQVLCAVLKLLPPLCAPAAPNHALNAPLGATGIPGPLDLGVTFSARAPRVCTLPPAVREGSSLTATEAVQAPERPRLRSEGREQTKYYFTSGSGAGRTGFFGTRSPNSALPDLLHHSSAGPSKPLKPSSSRTPEA